MFSLKQKQLIAEKVEEVLLSFNHPEMPASQPMFHLHVDGREAWSFADIEPNWTFSKETPPGVNPWNEAMDEKSA